MKISPKRKLCAGYPCGHQVKNFGQALKSWKKSILARTAGADTHAKKIGLKNFRLILRARQRSGEGVVRRNGCPKGCFWRVRFYSAPLRFVLKNTWEVLKTLRGQSRNGLSNNTLLDNCFSARRLRRSFGAPPRFFLSLSKVRLRVDPAVTKKQPKGN